jgi:hypothetical protein
VVNRDRSRVSVPLRHQSNERTAFFDPVVGTAARTACSDAL